MNSDPQENQNPSPRGPADEPAGDAEEKPITKKAPKTPDANPIDPRVGNR